MARRSCPYKKELLDLGGLEAWRLDLGGLEAWRLDLGSLEAWRHGGLEACLGGKPGGMGAWRHGGQLVSRTSHTLDALERSADYTG